MRSIIFSQSTAKIKPPGKYKNENMKYEKKIS